MDFKKEVFLSMSEDIRKELNKCPGAFKAFVACVWEEMSAEDMYARVIIRDRYKLHRATLLAQASLINRAVDEYLVMSALAMYD